MRVVLHTHLALAGTPSNYYYYCDCHYAGADAYGNAILDAAEDQIFADNSSILATLANMTALAVSLL